MLRLLSFSIRANHAQAIDAGDLIAIRGLEAHCHGLLIFYQLSWEFVLHIEEVTHRTSRWIAIDRLFPNALSVNQHFEGALASFITEVRQQERQLFVLLKRQVIREPFLAAASSSSLDSISSRLFSLLIELFLFLRIT